MTDQKAKKEKRPPVMMARVGTHLVALDDLAAADLERLPQRKPLKVTVSLARSVPQNRLYRALLKKTIENFPEDPFGMAEPLDEDALHEWVKFELGYTRRIRDRHGEREVTRSVAFDEMDQPTFAAFFARVKVLIETRFFPGIDSPTFEAEVRDMLAERLAA